MSKHTPGPWQMDGPEWFDGRDAYSVYSGGEESHWRGIAEIPCQHPTGADEQGEPIWSTDEANARLIAAAPELLEAAKKALDVLDENGPKYPAQVEAERACRDAIAKAEGKA